MAELNLGVIDVPYTNETGPRDPFRARITKKGRVHRSSAKRIQNWMEGKTNDEPDTTVTVARALEDKYHVMQVFYDQYEDEIAAAVIHGLEGALEDLYAGAPVRNPYAEVDEEISQGFRQWLLQGEIETLGLEGVPTKAALERRSARFKSGVGPSERPSFIDTGTYELAFRAWME